MKTIVYIDGFNLYYGALKGTFFKWLDLHAFFKRTLPSNCHVAEIKYFTARVSPLPSDPTAPDRQDVYLRALQSPRGGSVKIIEGHFKTKNPILPMASDPTRFVKVIRAEEKGSDVNLAVELVHDAWSGKFECAVVVSNDADLERSLRIAKQQLRKTIFLFTPGSPQRRRPVATLTRWSNKLFDMTDIDLKASQFPDVIEPGVIFKPHDWK